VLERIEDPNVIGFLITKPLQLMVVSSLLEQLPKHTRKELLIVDLFSDARGVSQRLSVIAHENCTTIFFENEKSVFARAINKRYSKLFIDSDVGFARNLTLISLKIRSPKTVLAVYEEGLGTYRNDMYRGLKKKALSCLGCGVYFGGNWLVKELYLYGPEECKNSLRSKKIKIHKEIQTLLQERRQEFEFIFDAAGFYQRLEMQINDRKKCVIYISNWQLDQAVISYLKSTIGLVIVKPHPHIKNVAEINSNEGFAFAKATVPAEMLIAWAASNFESVSVIHHGSSVVRYVYFDNVGFSYANSLNAEIFCREKLS
jgi:hypothetical protein